MTSILAAYLQNQYGKQGTHCTGKTHGILKFCQNTGNLVCSSCKFPDSQGKRYLKFAGKISQKMFKLNKSAKSVLCIL